MTEAVRICIFSRATRPSFASREICSRSMATGEPEDTQAAFEAIAAARIREDYSRGRSGGFLPRTAGPGPLR
jgi:hypothetical protein